MSCVVCGVELNKKPGRGRPTRYCSDTCKKEHNKLRARENRRNGKWPNQQLKGRKFRRPGTMCEIHNRHLVRRGRKRPRWECPECDNDRRRRKWRTDANWREKEKARLLKWRQSESFRAWERKYKLEQFIKRLRHSERLRGIYKRYFFVLRIRYGLHEMPYSGFVRRYKTDPDFRQRVREYQNKYYRLRKAVDPEYAAKEKVRDRRKGRKQRFGLSADDIAFMLAKQNHQCGICQESIDEPSCHVDHCHESGAVRGLLCRFCNLLLGRTLDWGGWDSWVRAASDYKQNPPHSPVKVAETPISPQFSTN